jgi:hypothetical protein
MEKSQGNQCITILNKNVIFFFLQKWRTGGQNRPCLGGLVPVKGGEDVGKGYRSVNIVQKLCTHVCEWKMRPVETIP